MQDYRRRPDQTRRAGKSIYLVVLDTHEHRDLGLKGNTVVIDLSRTSAEPEPEHILLALS